MADDTTVPEGSTPADDGPAADVALGPRLGRYQLVALLGAGGMGIVFEARDPELERTVAVKIMHAAAGELADLRMRREGQTMARLAHPNVIRVYDVGRAGGRPFVAMELVAGGTLAEWLARAPRTPAEILTVFAQAGRGLAAAHDAGLVHRDFKPSNVLVGHDGRIVVTDFGLARAATEGGEATDDPAAAAASPSLSSSISTITRGGPAPGTPAYMAPEQRAGRAVDARADQYSFCVSLRRALDGARIAPHVRAAIARGLADEPDARFPSMHALLAALDGRARPRRGALLAAAVVVAAGGLAAWLALGRGGGADPCGGVDRFAGVWDAAAAGAVHDAFVATHVSYADPSYREVARQLDRHRHAWNAMRRDSCIATRVRGDQPAATMDLRAACLDQRLAELAAFVAELRRADAGAVRSATSQAAAIGDVAPCADTANLTRRAPLPADPARRAAIAHVEDELAAERARDAVGNHRADEPLHVQLLADARAAGYAPTLSEALRAIAWADSRRDNDVDAAALLEESALAAERGGDDQSRFETEVLLTTVYGYQLERDALGQRHADQAQALLARLGDDPRRAAALARARAIIDWWNGRYPDARRRAQQAVDRYARVDPDGVELARALHLRAIVEQEMGDAQASVASEAQARAILDRTLGPEHPELAQSWETSGGSLRDLGRLDEAQAALERGLAIVQVSDGPDSRAAAGAYLNLGNLYEDRGDHARAIAMFQRSVEAAERSLGPEHSRVADALESLANALSGAGRADDAVAAYTRAIAIHERNLGADAPPTASSRRHLGEHYLRGGDPARARPLFAEVVRALEASQGKDSSMLALPLTDLADADLALHQAAAAAAEYRRAGVVVGADPHYDKLRGRIAAGVAATTR